MSTPTLLDAAKAKIKDRSLREYLLVQFPYTKGHIPLNVWLDNLEAAIAAHESASQEWAMEAASEFFWAERLKSKAELAAIIQKHAPASQERELAEALRSLVRPYESNAVAVDNHVRNKDRAREALSRYDERQK